MIIQVQPLRNEATVRDRLKRDGWELEQSQDGRFWTTHFAVNSESEARYRLNSLGLLTSTLARIEFATRKPD